jgi:hypothetical protein
MPRNSRGGRGGRGRFVGHRYVVVLGEHFEGVDVQPQGAGHRFGGEHAADPQPCADRAVGGPAMTSNTVLVQGMPPP